MSPKVQIHLSTPHLYVRTPFDPAFQEAAKKLAGRWDRTRKAWCFRATDETAVRALCQKHFGTEEGRITP